MFRPRGAATGDELEPRDRPNSMRTNSLPFLTGAFLCLIGGSNALAAAQGKNAGPVNLPPAPENRVLDTARVFTFEPEIFGRLSEALHEAFARNEIEVFIAAYSFLLDEPIESRASRLEEHWVTRPKGLVIAYVRGSDQVTYAASPEFESYLPKSDLDELFLAAATGVRELENPAERIAVATELFLQSIDERLHSVEEIRSVLRRDTILLAAIALALAAIVIRIGFRLFSFDRRPRETRHFPAIKIARRFGAAHGGGVLAEGSFAAALPTDERSTFPQS